MVFLKWLCWNMIFLVLSGKILPFLKNTILFFTRKMKDDLSKKIHGNMIFSSNALERWSFQKKSHWNMIFHRSYFFSRKYDIFCLDGKWKMAFLKKYMKTWYLQYICINVTNMILPFCKKKSKMIFSWKNTLKCGLHSWLHSRKSSNGSLYFYGDLHRCFHILILSEKKPGNLVYMIEIWLLLQFIWFDLF